MNIEEIKAAIKEKEAQSRALSNEINALRQDLLNAISAASEFQPGDRVNVVHHGKSEPGVFGGYQKRYGDIEPIVYKMKKDGKASKNRIFIYQSSKIEKT